MEKWSGTCEHTFRQGKRKGAMCVAASIPFNFGWSLCRKHAPWVKKAREIVECREIMEEFGLEEDFWNEEEDIAAWVEEMSGLPEAPDRDPWTEADFRDCEVHTPSNEGYEEEDKNVWFVGGKEVTQEVAEAEARRSDEEVGIPAGIREGPDCCTTATRAVTRTAEVLRHRIFHSINYGNRRKETNKGPGDQGPGRAQAGK